MAEHHINEFFYTVFTREDTNHIPEPEDQKPRTRLRKVRISSVKVKKKQCSETQQCSRLRWYITKFFAEL